MKVYIDIIEDMLSKGKQKILENTKAALAQKNIEYIIRNAPFPYEMMTVDEYLEIYNDQKTLSLLLYSLEYINDDTNCVVDLYNNGDYRFIQYIMYFNKNKGLNYVIRDLNIAAYKFITNDYNLNNVLCTIDDSRMLRLLVLFKYKGSSGDTFFNSFSSGNTFSKAFAHDAENLQESIRLINILNTFDIRFIINYLDDFIEIVTE